MTPSFKGVGIYDYRPHATSTIMMEARILSCDTIRMACLNSRSEDKLVGQEITSSWQASRRKKNQVVSHTGRPNAIASIVTLPNVSPNPCTQLFKLACASI
jgi:hypothetical protein